MRVFRFCTAALLMAIPSYSGAQTEDGLLGRPVPQISGAASGGVPKDVSAPGRAGASVAQRLGRVQADAAASLRGAAETKIYQQASPAVVLIISQDGYGSGALISADGQIITNAHVVGDAKSVGVIFKPKAEGAQVSKIDAVTAKVIKRDDISDLALIKVEVLPPGVTPLKLGALSSVQVGTDVNAIGHPTGDSWTFTRGIVSQIRRDYVWSYEDRIERRASVIQTQTPINPGNSGGPLLNDAAQIVGLNSFDEEGEGLNFAVSADDIQAFLTRSGDRLARAPVAKTAGKTKACELAELGSEYDKKNRGTYSEIDVDCDEKPDFVFFSPDSKEEPEAYLFDEDGDGKIETVIYDENHDGEFDYALYDTEGDGESDVRGDYRKGEDEPFRFERLAKR